MQTHRIRRWPFVVLCLLVCGIATGGSAFLGALATALYGTICSSNPPVEAGGPWLGAVGGLTGSLAWCILLIGLAVSQIRRTGRASAKLILWGTFAGHGAGLIACAILHGGLMWLNDKQWSEDGALWALGSSAVCGLGMGVLSGLMAWAMAIVAAPAPPAPAPPTPAEGTGR